MAPYGRGTGKDSFPENPIRVPPGKVCPSHTPAEVASPVPLPSFPKGVWTGHMGYGCSGT